MRRVQLPILRFRLASLLMLMLGIAIGYSLNWHTLQLMLGPPNEARMTSLPTYVIEPPDVLRVDLIGSVPDALSGVTGNHLVGPDGRVNLGTAGQVYVAGLTLEQAQAAIGTAVAKQTQSAKVLVDVSAYDSKKYYVIIRGAGNFETVFEAPITGNETVLDAIAHVGGIDAPDSTQVWISRPTPNGVGDEKKLPVDWKSVASGAFTGTNYQLMPGDRLYLRRKSSSAATN